MTRPPDLTDNKIAVIIPAFNEAERIGEVLKVVTNTSWIEETIVVDDGSADETSQKAEQFPIKVIKLPENVGKGAALQKGIEATDAEIINFLDADLVDLNEDHLKTLINPLLDDAELMMTVGRFSKGRLTTNLSQRLTPILNGQRGLKREFLSVLPNLSEYRFGVEIFISRFAANNDIKITDVELEGLSQVLKEEKKGIFKGTLERYKMYGQLLKTLKQTGKKEGSGLHS